MRILIVEDEPAAAGRLRSLLQRHVPDADIAATTESVKETAQWLIDRGMPELIFLDIQLADGLSFELFDLLEIRCPVIFTTAYDEYALKAFRVNSVDYLLKPINGTDLERAVKKFRNLYQGHAERGQSLQQLRELIGKFGSSYRNRFVIRVGDHIKSIQVSEVGYFMSREKITFACGRDQRRHILDHSLDQLEKMLDPQQFFRISRQYIVNLDAVADVTVYSSSRLRVILKEGSDMHLLVSREKTGLFKSWLAGE